MDKMHEEFELWLMKSDLAAWVKDVSVDENSGDYFSETVNLMFVAWQARAMPVERDVANQISKWKQVDGDMRERGGLITYHVDAFKEGMCSAQPSGEAVAVGYRYRHRALKKCLPGYGNGYGKWVHVGGTPSRIGKWVDSAGYETEVELTYTAPPAQVQDGWNPIETAPKDGTEIDLWVADIDPRFGACRVTDARWSATRNEWVHDSVDGDPIGFEGTDIVTHWMPLPDDPQSKGGK